MLRALQCRKRPFGGAHRGEEAREFLSPTRYEDPLTSTVFERMAYLDGARAWQLLRSLMEEAPLPLKVPSRLDFDFWPSLEPGPGAHNTVRVEPDVLVHWDGGSLIVEAKHHGMHMLSQWREEIAAVRARYPGEVWLLALGGSAPTDRGNAPMGAHVVVASWAEVARTARSMAKDGTSTNERRLLDDIAVGVEHWGYARPWLWFGTLDSTTCAPLDGAKSLRTLGAWRMGR